MLNKITRKIVFIGVAVSLLLAASLSAQHVTTEDVIRSGGLKSILNALANPKMEASNPRFFDLRVALIRALGKSANKGNASVHNQLAVCLGEGTQRIVRYNGMAFDYWKVRAEAAMALGRIGDKKATPHLIRAATDDGDLHVRICAVRAMGLIKDKKAVPRLLDILARTNNDMMAMSLVVALEGIGDKRAFPLLLAVSQRNFSSDVRNRALQALKNLKY